MIEATPYLKPRSGKRNGKYYEKDSFSIFII